MLTKGRPQCFAFVMPLLITLPQGENSPGPAPSQPKQGGWGDVTDSNDGPAIPDVSENNFGGNDNDDDVVDMIPTLEEEEEEDITRQVAEAPKISAASRLVPLRELDHEKLYNLMPQRGQQAIDLSLLMQHLTPQGQLNEPDELWDYDVLVKSVKDELQKEKDALDDHGAEVQAAT